MKEVEYFLVSEVDRLRRLIRSAVKSPVHGESVCPRRNGHCWWCSADIERDPTPQDHLPGCPWLALEAEAAKASDALR
jgi:hypothetical protein